MNIIRTAAMARTGAAFIFAVFFSYKGLSQEDPTSLLKTGDKVPSFICKTIDGKTIDISKLQGKIIMINFFATWCGPCNQELPVLQEMIWDKYRNNPGFELIVLGREHSEKEVRDFVTKKGFTMPFAPDPGREIFKMFASQNIPRNVIIGKDGRILFQNTGFSKDEFLKIEKLIGDSLN